MAADLLPSRGGLMWRRLAWLALLAPLFFVSYNFANGYTAQRDDVGSLVFAWETLIPLWPWTIVPYWSIDLLYGLSFLLPTSRRELDRHALRLVSAQLVCVAGFLLWPLQFTFERPELGGVFGAMFDVLMGFDKPYNQAPSLHITLLIVLWACFAAHLGGRWRWLLHGWFTLIGLSVLTTWQHHFIDLPTGVLAGWLCVWLWPSNAPAPWRHWRLHGDAKRLRLALRYAAGSAATLAVAIVFSGGWLWLWWPSLSLALVALNYAVLGPQGFQKQANGRLSTAATWLYAPYLALAWLNSRAWTRRHPQADEVCEGVFLGRLPSRREQAGFEAIVDLCAELPVHVRTPGYRALPVLDLTAPSAETCLAAAQAIDALRVSSPGPLLVCCALGYSRSATAVAAWLLYTGRCASAAQAFAQIRSARPQVVLHEAQKQALDAMPQRPPSCDTQGHADARQRRS